VIVLSNWDVTLPEVLGRVGLGELVDGVVSSAAAGARKPDPAIFARALALAEVKPTQARHVGDSLEEDVAGGRAAGIAVLWLNRAGDPVPSGVTAIGSLAELD
jgi:HAD superfamily hydrolase (TIGR01509 family)